MVYVYALLFPYEGSGSISGESLYSSNYSCIITVLAIVYATFPCYTLNMRLEIFV